MRLFGIELEGAIKFCGIMDLHRPLFQSSYNLIIQSILNASNAVSKMLLSRSAEEEKKETMEKNNWEKQIASNIAACTFNEGAAAYLLIMQALEINIGHNCAAYCEHQDRARIDVAEVRTQEATREGRIARRQQRSSWSDATTDVEGTSYGPGCRLEMDRLGGRVFTAKHVFSNLDVCRRPYFFSSQFPNNNFFLLYIVKTDL